MQGVRTLKAFWQNWQSRVVLMSLNNIASLESGNSTTSAYILPGMAGFEIMKRVAGLL